MARPIINAVAAAWMMGQVFPLAQPDWWLDPNQGITLGTAMLATGTTPPAVTLSGTRTFTGDLRMTIDTAGGTARGQAKFSTTFNGVVVDSGVTTAATVNATGVLSGLVYNFPNSTYNANNTYRSEIESWTDRVSGFVFTQATAANRPHYDPTGLNGLPCVVFDGTNDFLECTNASAYGWLSGASKSHAYTLLYQAVFNVADALNAVVSYANSASNTGWWLWGISNTVNGVWILGVNDGAGKSLESTDPDNIVPGLFEAWSTGTAASLRVNGDVADPSAGAQNPGSVTLNRVTIGRRSRLTADAVLSGKVGHVVQFFSNITEDQRKAWRQFLQLPAGYAMVLKSSRIILTSDEAHAGAGFVTMAINGGGNVSNASDKGRGLQCAANVNRDDFGSSAAYNPTAQGSKDDNGNSTSTSVSLLRVAPLGQKIIRTVTNPAFWLGAGDPGHVSNFQPSDWTFDLTAEANWLNNPSIIRWELLTTVGTLALVTDPNQLVIAAATQYFSTLLFDTPERLNPATNTLTAITSTEMDPNNPTFFGSTPIILSNSGVDRAVGVYTITSDPSGTRGMRISDFSQGGGPTLYSIAFQWQEYNNLFPGKTVRTKTFLLGGTKSQVQTAMVNDLYATYGLPP